MFLHLLAASLIAQQPLFKQYFPKPSGQNGFEEYIQASDIAASRQFTDLASFVQRVPGQDKPEGFPASDSFLDIERKFANRFSLILSLVRQGNSKPAWDPRGSMTPDTTFPELRQFKQLARFEAMAAEVDFADGQNLDAAQRIEDGLTFADQISSGPLVCRLVGIACASIMLNELGKHWQQLALPETEELLKYLNEKLAKSGSLSSTMNYEEKFAMDVLSGLRDNPQNFQAAAKENDFDNHPVPNYSDAQISEAAIQAMNRIKSFYDRIDQSLDGPEENLLGLASKLKESEDSKSSDLVEQMVSIASPILSGSIVAEERHRTQLRISYLTLAAIRYRWEAGRLANRIDDFTSPQERKDPSNASVFSYRKEQNWFRITRFGRDAMGEINIPVPVHQDADPTGSNTNAP